METLTIKVVDGIQCPNGHSELTPETAGKPVDEWRFQIRAFKVSDNRGHWSECLICKRWFNDSGEWE